MNMSNFQFPYEYPYGAEGGAAVLGKQIQVHKYDLYPSSFFLLGVEMAQKWNMKYRNRYKNRIFIQNSFLLTTELVF